MLYGECKRYLLEKLKEAGVKTRPYTSKKSLEKCMESHVAAVLFEREECARNGSKKRFRDEEGEKHKRRKIFDRSISFSVVIGEYSDDTAEELFERFLASLDAGLYVDGNFVEIEVVESDWVDKEDSLLKAQVAVQTLITFHGGLYRDTDYAPLRHIEVREIERKMRKEPANGIKNEFSGEHA